ncbi:uncharacterized protein LOC111087573 [Limulus polyphemus]|uniref:Uncharacterized protein LOC111087573 n=1 Tax=Limulus polyphemus TaxID=6850 RepID=A0ABM1T3B5_LIMPO|nr:uncharacterized protein LOC111087573 [Limulus polyphemus]
MLPPVAETKDRTYSVTEYDESMLLRLLELPHTWDNLHGHQSLSGRQKKKSHHGKHTTVLSSLLARYSVCDTHATSSEAQSSLSDPLTNQLTSGLNHNRNRKKCKKTFVPDNL